TPPNGTATHGRRVSRDSVEQYEQDEAPPFVEERPVAETSQVDVGYEGDPGGDDQEYSQYPPPTRFGPGAEQPFMSPPRFVPQPPEPEQAPYASPRYGQRHESEQGSATGGYGHTVADQGQPYSAGPYTQPPLSPLPNAFAQQPEPGGQTA